MLVGTAAVNIPPARWIVATQRLVLGMPRSIALGLTALAMAALLSLSAVGPCGDGGAADELAGDGLAITSFVPMLAIAVARVAFALVAHVVLRSGNATSDDASTCCCGCCRGSRCSWALAPPASFSSPRRPRMRRPRAPARR